MGSRRRDEDEPTLPQVLQDLWLLFRDCGYLYWPDDPAEEPEVRFLGLGAADRRALPKLLARVDLDGSHLTDIGRTTILIDRYAARWFRCLWRRGVSRGAGSDSGWQCWQR